MKKSYFLMTLLMIFASVVVSKAQSYDLKDLTMDQFVSGGTDEWSFERHDVNSDVYSSFTTCDENSTAVNFYDQYITERFNLYPIMNRPASGTQYEQKRTAWYAAVNEFVYVAHEYADDVTIGDNIVYGTNYPDTLKGYEVYADSKGVSAAITFTVPETGYYKVDMKVIRMDLWSKIGPMKVYQYFRYEGEGPGYPMGQDFDYGIGQGIDLVQPENLELYNKYVALIPEFPQVVNGGGQPLRGLPTGSTTEYFYFYAKEGDKLSFETDARSTNNGENTPRGAYARTKWSNLVVEKTDEATAKANASKFVSPYDENPTLLAELQDKMAEAESVINDFEYSQASRDALEAYYMLIDSRLTAGAIKSMEIPSVIKEFDKIIAVCRASTVGLKVRYLFDDVTDNIVPDVSGTGNDGKLNKATIKALGDGKFNVLELGTENGYLDMGATVGDAFCTTGDYTISTYYRIDANADISGNGRMLFTFSSLEANASTAGEYVFYRVPGQKYSMASAGWSTEKTLNRNADPIKGEWQHLVIQQTGETCTIYVNGVEVITGELTKPSLNFTAPTAYNWIGRPPFGGDRYLQQTMVYDFRVYNYAFPVNTDSITTWTETVLALDNATNFGTDGDYTELEDLIKKYAAIADAAVAGEATGEYPQEAIDAFKASIAAADELANTDNVSQVRLDVEVKALNTAYQTFSVSVVYEANTLDEGLYYITVNNSLYLTNPGAEALADKQTLTIANGGLSATKVADNTQAWKLTKVMALDPFRYSIYSELDENGVKRHLTETAVLQSAWGGSDNNWRTFNILYNGTGYAVQSAGAAASKGDWTYDATKESLAFGAKIPFIFNFIPFTGDGIENGVNSNGVKITADNNAIKVVTETSATVTVYSISGALVKQVSVSGEQIIPVQSGLYIVKVQGEETAVGKVVVK
ncbi:T9SS C-terminal target domain-containing protein [Dysgonomonas sp. 216]|uniref:LamG-like jellyroll fold domain-containing protein n=1 Tax=Dysgonomonas sp. 216 TaxID=2302934 RepID=UPI0013D5413F|nr:LamG-like jellyroll fold domain-containing protein [Dysgonomonas sp. 216]NDW19681.1 T9SS C-terminal target domain-containing protein [Dysgonomonas sp. 216]